jgi:hypothetical protein
MADEVRVMLHGLWADHVFWTLQYVSAFSFQQPNSDVVAQRLLLNQEHIGSALGQVYGAKVASAVTKLLKEHISGAVDLLKAARAHLLEKQAGAQEQLKKASDAWNANGQAIADALHGISPRSFNREVMRQAMQTHLDTTLAYAVPLLKGEYADSIQAFDVARGHIGHMADALAAGIEQDLAKKTATGAQFIGCAECGKDACIRSPAGGLAPQPFCCKEHSDTYWKRIETEAPDMLVGDEFIEASVLDRLKAGLGRFQVERIKFPASGGKTLALSIGDIALLLVRLAGAEGGAYAKKRQTRDRIFQRAFELAGEKTQLNALKEQYKLAYAEALRDEKRSLPHPTLVAAAKLTPTKPLTNTEEKRLVEQFGIMVARAMQERPLDNPSERLHFAQAALDLRSVIRPVVQAAEYAGLNFLTSNFLFDEF